MKEASKVDKRERVYSKKSLRIYTIDELLKMPIIAKGTPESIEKEIDEESRIQEKRTNKEH
ncbi:MAG: hypothetical protein ACTSQS_17340 [Promethearchaeota archaeon]